MLRNLLEPRARKSLNVLDRIVRVQNKLASELEVPSGHDSSFKVARTPGRVLPML
jgi:hypothetical protein